MSDRSETVAAVVLAAGANTRLKGLVPPYMKPLLMINGKPLVRHAVDHALGQWHVDELIYVVAPENARQLYSVRTVPHAQDAVPEHWLVQPEPLGVPDALARALIAVRSTRVLVLCADNTFSMLSEKTVDDAISHPTLSFMGARMLDLNMMARFTRWRSRDGLKEASLTSGEGLEILRPGDERPGEGCWLGPLLLHTGELRRALCDHPDDVVDMLNKTTHEGKNMRVIWMDCHDLGTPEEHQ